MTIVMESDTPRTASARVPGPEASWIAVVGFDGTKPSLAALTAAAQLSRDRAGQLEVVYVGHVPLYAAMSAEAVLSIRQGFPVIARELVDTAQAALDDGGASVHWHFQRRDGSVAAELLAAATELRHRHGADLIVEIIIGSSPHRRHHGVGSVAASLAHETSFPLLTVPSSTNGSPRPGSTVTEEVRHD